MSEFGGILNFDAEAPINPADMRLLSSALGGDDHENVNVVVDGPFGLCFSPSRAGKKIGTGRQPLVDSSGNVFAFDGMLHNPDELRHMLNDSPVRTQLESPDVDFLRRSYLRWGGDCIARLIGDFALVIWDKQDQTILLARDHAGTHTLYYHRGTDRIIWSSQLELLLSLVGSAPEIEDQYIAWYLVYSPPVHLTPFRGILAVRPGHAVSVQRQKFTETRYWGLDTTKEIRHESDGEYEEHYFHEFKNAVKCRMRSDGPVFAELSGGLDSSAVVCMADHLIKTGEATVSELQPISAVNDLSPKSNELKFINYVEEHIGYTGIHLKESECPLFTQLSAENAGKYLNPLLFSAEYHYTLGRLFRARHASILLSGQGGDEINNSGCDPTAELCDLWAGLKLYQLHHRIKAWSSYQKKAYPKVLWKNVLAPTLLLNNSCWGRRASKIRIPKLLHSSLIQKADLSKDKILSDPFGFKTPSGRDQAIGYCSVVLDIATGHRRHMSGFHASYPYMHRPFVEFMQAVPIGQKIRPGQSRSLHRRALTHIMPAKTVKRKSKGDPTEAMCRAVDKEWRRLTSLLSNARIYQYEYIDQGEMERALEMTRNGVNDFLINIIKAATLELWLRALESPSKSSSRNNSVRKIDTHGLIYPI